ncbi:MAG: methionyl-tRNA formyltransferase [Candidatus Xenolissoclinum pacificiensis L6]|uniref:Methionyl-tRNA formyltransferase n=1 Tax=Candidatus Xenolissoclinum pacificiensis L6 TaxID=1401685 RepID=W2V0T8_9RICK|nr:MAG: methionyl-tRNA formyltransferase [Candidatus Xenolissoclinum pacificiensis L6]
MALNIVFMGSPSFAVPSLKFLHNSNDINVVAVCTQPPKAQGRKKMITPTIIHKLADDLNITVIHDFKNLYTIPDLDFIAVVAYGMFLPSEILSLPKYSSLNVHPSLLPKLRGPAPIQYALLNNHQYTGVSIIKLIEKMDAGDILLQERLNIKIQDRYSDLENKLSEMGAELLLRALKEYSNITPRKQDHKNVSFSHKIQDIQIDWLHDNVLTVYNKVRAFDGAKCMVQDYQVKIVSANIITDNTTNKVAPGKILDAKYIKCLDGLIEPITILPAGKKVMPFQDFLRGIKC